MPTRRSTAEAFQILISHAFGDAGSPYLIGLISEGLKTSLGSSGNATHSIARRTVNETIKVSKQNAKVENKQNLNAIHLFIA